MSSEKVNAVSLQERDLALLRGLFESRVMTTVHVATLFFGGKREYSKKRLQKLKAVGFISERKRRVNEPSILFLTRKAFGILKAGGHIDDFPTLGVNSFEARANVSDLTIRHELEIMDVKTSFFRALADSQQFSIAEFGTWPLLYQFETTRIGHGGDAIVRPDGFIRIREADENPKGSFREFFLEVDRSSESQDTLVNKAACYREYYRTGGFAVRNGASRTDYEMFPFRVLIVLKSAERRNNFAERLIQINPPVLRMTWLTTLAEVTTDPLGSIWIQPVDYRDAIKDTRFYRETRHYNFEYRRQPEREAFVETKIQKRKLLES